MTFLLNSEGVRYHLERIKWEHQKPMLYYKNTYGQQLQSQLGFPVLDKIVALVNNISINKGSVGERTRAPFIFWSSSHTVNDFEVIFQYKHPLQIMKLPSDIENKL